MGGRRPLHQASGSVKLREGGGGHGGLIAGVQLLLEGGEVPGVRLTLAAGRCGPGQIQS